MFLTQKKDRLLRTQGHRLKGGRGPKDATALTRLAEESLDPKMWGLLWKFGEVPIRPLSIFATLISQWA